MNDYVLRSKADAESVLAGLFADCVASDGEHLRLEVHEDKCFRPDAWVSVGTVSIHPELPGASPPEDGNVLLERAFRYGSFDWKTPKKERLKRELTETLEIEVTQRSRNRFTKNINEVIKGGSSGFRVGGVT